jgi:hypothetical protein
MSKRTICLDFDGVIHSYTSGFQGVDVIADPPVPGAREAVVELLDFGYDVTVFSTRCISFKGSEAMRAWLRKHQFDDRLRVSADKPPALLYVDDRGYRFEGDWDAVVCFATQSCALAPWNKK